MYLAAFKIALQKISRQPQWLSVGLARHVAEFDTNLVAVTTWKNLSESGSSLRHLEKLKWLFKNTPPQVKLILPIHESGGVRR